jgi:hypothetical protein
MRYMPTTVKSSDHNGQRVYLARGVDRAGNDYADPGAINERWVDDNPRMQQIARLCAESKAGLLP